MILAVLIGIAAPQPSRPQPVLLERGAFSCLMRHLDTLRTTKTVIIDLKKCPPSLLQGSYPVPPGDRLVRLDASDIQCLKATRRGNSRVVFRSGSGHVALYLSPCGRSR